MIFKKRTEGCLPKISVWLPLEGSAIFYIIYSTRYMEWGEEKATLSLRWLALITKVKERLLLHRTGMCLKPGGPLGALPSAAWEQLEDQVCSGENKFKQTNLEYINGKLQNISRNCLLKSKLLCLPTREVFSKGLEQKPTLCISR